MKKLEISKLKSKLKEWARSWISLDWDKTNIWEKRQNTVSAFFPWIPIIFFYTFKEENILANILQVIIALVSVSFLFHVLKSRNFINRFFLVCQALLTLTISVLILSKLLEPSDLNILLELFNSFLYLEITIMAIILMFYESDSKILKINSWIRFVFFLAFLSSCFVIIFFFSELNTENIFIVTAFYGVWIKLTEPKTFLSEFYPDEDFDSCVIKKNIKIIFNIIKDMLVIIYLSILIMTSYYKKIISHFKVFTDPNSKKGFNKVVLIASEKTLIMGFIAVCFFGLFALILWIGKKNKLNEKFIEKENRFKNNKVRRRFLQKLLHQ